MATWVVFPSKRPVEELARVVALWRERGYKVAVSRDLGDDCCDTDVWLSLNPYPGYAASVNALVRIVLDRDPDCDWLVIAADDIEPDPSKTADQIARECGLWFADWPSAWHHSNMWHHTIDALYPRLSTFGVMQPTGHRWGVHADAHDFLGALTDTRCLSCGFSRDSDRHMSGAYIDRVAGSAWVGREWCARANQGLGPLWPGFFHMFVDEHLKLLAEKLGVYWMRRDLTHLHRHWGLPREGETMGLASRMPDFLKKANSREEWDKGKNLLKEIIAEDFKRCLPL